MPKQLGLITGATSGIGKATAFELAASNYALVLLCRDEKKGESVVREITNRSGNAEIELLIADLSSQDSIRAAAETFLKKHSSLQLLVNNAGIAVMKRTLSKDGIEMTFAVNHLAYFLLTNLLLDALKSGAPSRIINVSSEGHRNGKFDVDNLQSEKHFSGFGAYCITKLCNLLFTYELARRLEGTGVTVNAMHPGFLNTSIFREAKGFLKFLVRLTARRPETGAKAIAYLAKSQELEGVTGKYFNGRRMANSSKQSHNSQDAKRLWEISEGLTRGSGAD
jgi:NAD(P)-dependent dehydrogenase (short-subunit alcohol dehydrogenase family)